MGKTETTWLHNFRTFDCRRDDLYLSVITTIMYNGVQLRARKTTIVSGIRKRQSKLSCLMQRMGHAQLLLVLQVRITLDNREATVVLGSWAQNNGVNGGTVDVA